MALQWQAPFQINPYAPSQTTQALGQLGDTFSNIGDTALRYRQQQAENQRQQALLAIQQAENARRGQGQVWEYGYDAGAPYGGQPLDVRSGVQPSPLSQYPPAGGTASAWSPQGPSPSASLQQGTMGPFPQGQSTANMPLPTPSGSLQTSPQMPIDHTSHFMNWKGMGMPTNYDHPDYGGTGQAIGMQRNPMAPQTSGQNYNPSDPYGIGMTMGQGGIGAKQYGLALEGARARAQGRVAAPLAKKLFGAASPQDLALSGLDPNKLAELESSMNYKNAALGMAGTRLTNEVQLPAQKEAEILYNSYVQTDTASSDALKALSQAQKNPAMFNTALFNVGKALGLTSRNPQMIIQAIAAGDPSLAGQVQEYISKKGKGQLTPELLNGLQTMVGDLQQSNKVGFEQKAAAHAQQNAKYYGGNVNQAKSSLFPTYQWGGGQGGGQGGNNNDPLGIR
jgi:hypothetical protein